MLIFLWHFYEGQLKLRATNKWQGFEGGRLRAEQNVGTFIKICKYRTKSSCSLAPSDSWYLIVLLEI